jgi:hypothetical protein
MFKNITQYLLLIQAKKSTTSIEKTTQIKKFMGGGKTTLTDYQFSNLM